MPPVVLYGIHVVRRKVKQMPHSVHHLLVSSGRHDARIEDVVLLAERAGIEIRTVEPGHLDSLTAEGIHQGVAAVCEPTRPATERQLEERWHLFEQPLIVVLDGVKDPRNLGACARAADAAGVDFMLVPKRNSAPLSAVAYKAASGALESMLVVTVTNLVRRMEWLRQQGVWITGTVSDAERSYLDVDYTGPTAIVLGGEERGLRRLTRETCDHLVTIPMLGSVSSLNVSVASGIVLYEAVRQRSIASSQ